MTKPKTLEQLRADKERAETQLAQEQHKLERLENRLSHAHIGVISAPMCAFYHHSLGGFFHCFHPTLPAFFGFWVKNGSEKILKLQNKSCQAFVQYNFYHIDTRNLECGCRLSILRFRAP